MLALYNKVSRSLVAPTEMPMGAVTALLSDPLFVLLLRRAAAFGEP